MLVHTTIDEYWSLQQSAKLSAVPDSEPVQPNPIPERLTRLHTWQLSTATQRGHRLLAGRLAEAGLRMQHYRVLAGLAQVPETTQVALGSALDIDPANMVSLLTDLEQRRCVVRSPDPDNRRRNLVRISPGGRRMLIRLDRLVAQANDALLAPLNRAERDQLLALLTRVVQQ
jgi:MarR family transcriptional regulator, lower aerobic nicotinate degradation pathway regulator